RAVVRYALRLARYRSYRDSGSKQLLADMKFTHADRVVPDLAFSYPVDVAEPGVEGAKETLKVGISPIAYLRKGHWPKTDGGIFERYCETLQAFTTELVRRGHEVVLFATDAPDREVSELVAAQVKAACGQSNGRLKLRIAPISRVHELLAELKTLDCVVASRLHGVILSHLCLRPVLAISYDRKVTRHMNDMEQANYCLDFHTLDVAQLVKTFESLALRRDAVTAILKRRTHAYRTELKSQYDDLARRVDL
ncbi:MAG: polysaccharide pyruvyl transferase family protein, partial [Verrucomicrobia bacterium]|nr:polysaccharide pyruvyl transferase family protein [Verrucomicrobiota bacterium]